MDADSPVVDLPYEFRTVDTFIRPLERQVVWPPLKLAGGLPELADGLCGQNPVSLAQALHHVVASVSAGDPFFQWGVSNRVDSLVYVGTPVPEENDSHMTITRVGRLLNRDALRRPRRVKDNISISKLFREGTAASGQIKQAERRKGE